MQLKRRWPHVVKIVLGILIGLGISLQAAIDRDSYRLTENNLIISRALLGAPDWIVYAIGVQLVVGGVAWLWSNYHWFDDLREYWAWNRIGLLLAATGWSSYTLLTTYDLATTVGTWIFSLAYAVVMWGELVISFREEHRVKTRLAI